MHMVKYYPNRRIYDPHAIGWIISFFVIQETISQE